MKVPVVLQITAVECGAACLSMVLQAHEIPATLADCRQHLAPGPDGVNALGLSEVALKFGLRAKAYSASTRSVVQQLSLPAIAHFGHNHFVVLEGWSRLRDTVSIVDPAVGRRRLAWSEFLERFSGVALAFEPSSTPPALTPQASRPRRDIVIQLLRLPNVRRLAIQLLAATIFLGLLGAALPLAAGRLVDGAPMPDPLQRVNVLGAGVAALVLTLILLDYLRSSLLVYFGSRAAAAMALSPLQQLLGLPPAFSDPRVSDEPTRRLLRRTRLAVARHAVSIGVDGLWMLISALALLAIAPPAFGIAMVAAAGLQTMLMLAGGGSLASPSRRAVAVGLEPSICALELLDGLTSDRNDPARAWSWLRPAFATIRAAALLLPLWMGTQMILRQQATPGTLLTATSLAVQFLGTIGSVLSADRRLRSVGPHLQALALALEERARQLRSAIPAI